MTEGFRTFLKQSTSPRAFSKSSYRSPLFILKYRKESLVKSKTIKSNFYDVLNVFLDLCLSLCTWALTKVKDKFLSLFGWGLCVLVKIVIIGYQVRFGLLYWQCVDSQFPSSDFVGVVLAGSLKFAPDPFYAQFIHLMVNLNGTNKSLFRWFILRTFSTSKWMMSFLLGTNGWRLLLDFIIYWRQFQIFVWYSTLFIKSSGSYN